MFMYKQDLAAAYFPDHSKESASKRFAHEIHSNNPLLAALQATHYLHPPFLVHPDGILAAAIPSPSSPKKIQQQTPNNQPYPKTAAKNFQFPCYFFVFLRLI